MPLHTNKTSVAVSLFLLAAVALVLKSPDAFIYPQFWAEDGPIFFLAQFQQASPPLHASYAGYLHTLPRLVAWLAHGFPVAHAPLIFNASAILIEAAAIAFVTVRLAHWCSPVAVFLAFFVVPAAGDIFGTITNAQWFTQFALVTACFVPGNRATETSPTVLRVLGLACLALVALTGPFSVLVTGLAFAAWMLSRIPHSWQGRAQPLLASIGQSMRNVAKVELGIVAVCAGFQALALLSSEVRTSPALYELSEAQQTGLGLTSLGSFYSYTVNRPFTVGHLLALMVLALVARKTTVDAMRNPGPDGNLSLMLLAIGVAEPLLAFMKQREWHTLAATSHYFYFLDVVACWLLWRIMSAHKPSTRRWAASFAGLAIAVGAVVQPNLFRREPFHDLGWPGYAQQISAGAPGPIVVPLNPVPWGFTLHQNFARPDVAIAQPH